MSLVTSLQDVLVTNYLHTTYFFQMVDADFDIKTKILELLQDKDFDKKRARTMDIDDFLQ